MMREYYQKEGSSLPLLRQKRPKNNKTGVKGVCWVEKKQRYVASLKFQGHNYHLGSYKTLEEAVQARLEGEEKYYKPFLDKYKIYFSSRGESVFGKYQKAGKKYDK
jgi:hypothetical protein